MPATTACALRWATTATSASTGWPTPSTRCWTVKAAQCSNSRRLLQAQEDERQRLARDLHDEAAQALTSLLVHLRLWNAPTTPEEAQQRVLELRELTFVCWTRPRHVALDLRPTILDDLGLERWNGASMSSTADGVRASVEINKLSQRLPRDTELALYRVGKALNNVAKHARRAR
ncbi:MAG: histidine kinase [Caldilineaceae bacterium]